MPNLDFRLETFRQLSSELGRDAVVWRFDPLLLTKTVSVETLLARIIALGDILKDWTKRLVFSFADIAALFDKTETWARVTFYRARTKLKEALT